MLTPQEERAPAEGKSLQVVYVGDETRGRAVAEEMGGSEVRRVRSGADALTCLESAEVDCVVAEPDLADVDGQELLDAVAELHPTTARVILAESPDEVPWDVGFVPTRPAGSLPERIARRVERTVEQLPTYRECALLADRFETLVEKSPDPILIVDEDGRVVFANEAVERVFGYDRESVVGEPVLGLLAEDVHAKFETCVASLVADEGTVEHDYLELPGKHRDGREIPLAISFTETERDGDHNFTAIVRDVSERQRLKQNLEAEKRKTKELHEVAVMLEECDSAVEVCQLAVETAEQLLEFDLCAVDTVEDGELVPQAVSKGVPTDGYYTTTPLDAEDNLAARAYRQGESLRTHDLHEEGVNPAASGYRAALTVPVGDVGVFQAVSKEAGAFDESDRELAELLVSHVAQSLQRIRSETELEAECDRFAALFENTRDAIVYYEMEDGELVFRDVNEAFEEVFGFDAEAVSGEAILDHEIIPADKHGEVAHHIEQLLDGQHVEAEVRRKTKGGMRDFLLRTAGVPGDPTSGYVIYTDITERKRSEERHRSMTEDVLDNTDVGIFVLDDEFDVAWANSTVEEYFGLDRESVVSEDKRTLVEDRIRHLVDDSGTFAETVLETYDDNTYEEEFTCHVTPGADREERHLQHRSRPIESGLYAGGRVELYYDVTERTEREEMLDALHGATRYLMVAGSQREICQTTVETAREVLDIPHSTIFRWNEDAQLLEPFAIPEDTTGEIGDPPTFERGEGLVGSVFESGEVAVWDDVQTDPRTHEEGNEAIRGFCVLPMGEWGAMTLISQSAGAFDDYEIDLVKVLASNAEVALDRAAREAELAEQRSRLAELDRINEVIRDVDQLLVRASTREEIVQAVCDRLAESDHYRFAWTGETVTGGTRAKPTAWAGVEEGYLEETVEMREEASSGPVETALETGTVQVVQSVHEDDAFEPWREEALERGYRSMATIPLRYRETVYGVLCVYADRANAFDAREQAVLAELGETIGHAINAAESKKALVSDDVLEVEFEVRGGEGFFARVPQKESGQFTLEGVTMTAEGSFVYFMTVDGIDPDRVLELAESADDVERARLVNEHDDGNLFEFVYTGPSPVPELADHGGTLRDAEFTEDGGRSVVELPRSVEVRPVLESIQSALPDTKVAAQRERERPEKTVEELRTALEDQLTERQRSALKAAYYAGFFEWPRESNGEEVSESLGVSAPTFHQHLRVGERKLLSAFLDE